MSEQPLTPKSLVRYWKTFVSEWRKKNNTKTGEPPFGQFMDWFIENDGNKNPHRYELDDNGPES